MKHIFISIFGKSRDQTCQIWEYTYENSRPFYKYFTYENTIFANIIHMQILFLATLYILHIWSCLVKYVKYTKTYKFQYQRICLAIIIFHSHLPAKVYWLWISQHDQHLTLGMSNPGFRGIWQNGAHARNRRALSMDAFARVSGHTQCRWRNHQIANGETTYSILLSPPFLL